MSTKDKTIYFALLHLKVGGVEISVINLANSLVKHGYSVCFICLLRDNALSEMIDDRIKIEYVTNLYSNNTSIFYKIKWRLCGLFLLKNRLSKIHDSIVIATSFDINKMVSKHVSKDNIRIAQLHHDYIHNKTFKNDLINKYKNIDYLVVLTDEVKKEIINLINNYNNATQIIAIPHFYSGRPLYRATRDLHDNYSIAVGRLEKEKGFDRLIDIWEKIKIRTKGKLKLKIIGEGSQRSSLEEKIRQMNLSDVITLVGTKTNKETQLLMSKAINYCMTSYTESFSLVLLESLTLGLPQVAYDVRVGPRNLMINNQTGFLISDGDVNEFVDAVIKLYQDTSLWQKMSENSLNRARVFSETEVIQQWEKILINKA